MSRMRAGAVALLLTAGTGLVLTGTAGTVAAASSSPKVTAPVTTTSAAQAFVDRAYADLLDVAPDEDPTGIAYWVTQVNAGMSHAAVASALMQSAVYRDGIVNAAYQACLGRAADPGGLAYWANYLAKGGSVAQLTGSLVGSTEYTSEFGTQYGPFVQAAYQTLLGRPTDAAGLSYWVAQLSSGNPMWHVAASLSHSNEWFSNRVSNDFIHYHVAGTTAQIASDAIAMEHGTPEYQVIAGIVGSTAYQTFATTNP